MADNFISIQDRLNHEFWQMLFMSVAEVGAW